MKELRSKLNELRRSNETLIEVCGRGDVRAGEPMTQCADLVHRVLEQEHGEAMDAKTELAHQASKAKRELSSLKLQVSTLEKALDEERTAHDELKCAASSSVADAKAAERRAEEAVGREEAANREADELRATIQVRSVWMLSCASRNPHVCRVCVGC